MVVLSLAAAAQPSSGEPPSHMPANAAMERAARRYMTRSQSDACWGSQRSSSGAGAGARGAPPASISGRRAYTSLPGGGGDLAPGLSGPSARDGAGAEAADGGAGPPPASLDISTPRLLGCDAPLRDCASPRKRTPNARPSGGRERERETPAPQHRPNFFFRTERRAFRPCPGVARTARSPRVSSPFSFYKTRKRFLYRNKHVFLLCHVILSSIQTNISTFPFNLSIVHFPHNLNL